MTTIHGDAPENAVSTDGASLDAGLDAGLDVEALEGAQEAAGCASCVSRRSVLIGAAAAAATALAGAAIATAEPAAAAGSWVSVGKLTAFKVNVIKVIDPNRTPIKGLDRPVAITRHAGNKVTALDARCTHQGCTVLAKAGKSFVCPCHYSKFAASGKRLAGPAPTNLRTVKARVSGGKVQVWINPSSY